MAMAGLTLDEDLAVQHIEHYGQRSCVVALVVVRMVATRPFFNGDPGWVRSNAST